LRWVGSGVFGAMGWVVLGAGWCVGQEAGEEGDFYSAEDVPFSVIAADYEAFTGKRVIRDNAAAGKTFSLSFAGLEDGEAADMIERTLLLNGIALVPAGPGAVKALLVEGGLKPSTEGAPLVLDAARLPEGEQVVTFLIPLEYLDKEDAIGVLESSVPLHSYGSVTAAPHARALVVVENSATVRAMLGLLREIDVPPSERVQEVFDLERALAGEVVEALTEMLGLGEASRRTGGVSEVGVRPGVEAEVGDGRAGVEEAGVGALVSMAGGGGPAREAAPPQLLAVARTNQVVCYARPVELIRIRQLVEVLDAPASFEQFRVWNLRYRAVGELLDLAHDALLRGLGEAGEGGGAGAGQGGGGRLTSAGGGVDGGGLGGGLGGVGGGSGGGAAGVGVGGVAMPEELGSPRSVLVGGTLLIADPVANQLYVAGPPEHQRIIDELVERLDSRPRQVLLTAVIGRLSLSDDFEYGVDLLRTVEEVGAWPDGSLGAGLLRTRGGRGGALLEPGALQRVGDFVDLSGLTLYGRVGEHLNVFLDLLEQTERFKVLSTPSVFALNNTKATIATGQRVAVPGTTSSFQDPGSVNQSVTTTIQYEDVELRLEVVPLINAEGEVTLRIAQQNNDIVGSTEIGGNRVPTIGTQGLNTTVVVPDGGTVFLGGLISETESETRRGLPLFSSIPVVKYLVSSTVKQSERSELVILIRPTIIDGPLFEPGRAVPGPMVGLDLLPILEAEVGVARDLSERPGGLGLGVGEEVVRAVAVPEGALGGRGEKRGWFSGLRSFFGGD
jgi:general secretion pathway protein D